MSNLMGNLAARAVGSPSVLQPAPAYGAGSAVLAPELPASILAPRRRALDSTAPESESVLKPAARDLPVLSSEPLSGTEEDRDPLAAGTNPSVLSAQPGQTPLRNPRSSIEPKAASGEPSDGRGLVLPAPGFSNRTAPADPAAASRSPRDPEKDAGFAPNLEQSGELSPEDRAAPDLLRTHSERPLQRRNRTEAPVGAASEVTSHSEVPPEDSTAFPSTTAPDVIRPFSPSAAPAHDPRIVRESSISNSALLPASHDQPAAMPYRGRQRAAGTAEKPRPVHQTLSVSIGKIEVRSEAKPATRRSSGPAPLRSLAGYLSCREENRP